MIVTNIQQCEKFMSLPLDQDIVGLIEKFSEGDLDGKYYTYLLMRPDGSVFYVGKGTGNRINEHEQEAKRGEQSHKCNVIRQAWSDGKQIIKQKVAFFNEEEKAYQLEILLINFFGRENLTNQRDGGEGGSVPGRRGNYKKHKRITVSYSGDLLDLAYEKLADRGNATPTEDQIKDFIRAMTRKGLEQ